MDNDKIRIIYTYPDRKTFQSEMGIATMASTKFLWGKPENKILLLQKLITENKRKIKDSDAAL